MNISLERLIKRLRLIIYCNKSAKFMKLLKKNIKIRNKYIKLFVDFNKTYHLENSFKKKIINFINIISKYSKN
jgi:hypothetical protein